jgi:hypothetical protein
LYFAAAGGAERGQRAAMKAVFGDDYRGLFYTLVMTV